MPARDEDERREPTFPVPLSSAHVAEALNRSPDGGVTLFLSKLSVSDIGANEATELALAGRNGRKETDSVVERLALGNNRLTTLPTEFALLAHLRYLNLRHNAFSSFPDVLTLMPSLDTLDISYNKIKRLPPYPGNLTRLRVFSFSRNKVTRLPTYLTQFRQLDVLQADRNPIDWPPPAVLDSFGDSQDLKHGKEWVRNLQAWMDADISRGREFEDSGYSEQPDWGNESSYHESWRFPVNEASSDSNLTPHARSFSIDSDVSSSSILNSLHDTEQSKPPAVPKRRPLNLTTNGKSFSRPTDLSETFSTSSYTPSPVSASHSDAGLPEPEAMHVRTVSHASSLRKPQSSAVAAKKSLPDLRTSKDSKKYIPTLPEHRSPNVVVKSSDERFAPGPRQDSGSSTGSLPPAYDDDVDSSNPQMVPFMAVERSSYFRRSSTIPANHSLPKSLQVLLESARGILFAMGQLYKTLDQYVHESGNDRLVMIFKQVLDPANVTMLHLIRSLDRFDDVSQRAAPSSAVCRALVESCRDTVTVFRKAVGLLSLQMGVDNSEDARYIRWLILDLYASSAELSHSWRSLLSQFDSLKPFLSGTHFLKTPTPSFPSHGSLDSSASLAPPHQTSQLAPPVRLRPTVSEGSGPGAGRTRTARRHAGSFSTKDIQIGKELPNYDIVLPLMPSGFPSPSLTPTMRIPKRQMTLPVVTTSTPNSTSLSFHAPLYQGSLSDSMSHTRGISQSSLGDGTLLSPSVIHDSPARHMQNEDETLQAVQHTIDLAPEVWDQIEEALADVAGAHPDIQESIEQARAATKRLSDDIIVLSEGYSDADRRLLRENAHFFLKTLVQLSNILKAYGTPRSVPSALRANMVKLTNSSEEFAVLLHVSSVSSHNPRPYSPVSNSKYALYTNPPYPPEDNQLLSSLSRSRSAQPSSAVSSKLSASTVYDFPRSGTAPLVTNKNNGVRRLRLPREAPNENADPG